MDERYIFRPIFKEELPDMFALIRSRVQWMDEVGIEQWNKTDYEGCYPLSYYEGHYEQGEVFVLAERETGTLMSAAVLKHEDDRWSEEQNRDSALYLHNFASRIGSKTGSLFLRLAERYAADAGCEWFRLDSADDNVFLEQYYAARGYEPAGTCEDGLYTGVLRQKKLK